MGTHRYLLPRRRHVFPVTPLARPRRLLPGNGLSGRPGRPPGPAEVQARVAGRRECGAVRQRTECLTRVPTVHCLHYRHAGKH